MHVSVVIVGAGPGGLSMSYRLTEAGVDHVVLERGEVANSWRHERWDSLRLLTPNWMTALPGYRYDGGDPDGFMPATETAAFLEDYRRHFDPPLLTGVTVDAVERTADGFEVRTGDARFECDVVVSAAGGSSAPRIPSLAVDVPRHIAQLTALDYRRPADVDAWRPVLVVGASASGVQIADELQRAGRDVTIAAGEHIRLPRRYRGRDIYWWLDAIGQLDERYDEVEDLARARRHASVQLVGSDDRHDLDLHALHRGGVQVIGRLMALRGTTAQFSGGLANLVKNADLKQTRLLRRIDEYVVEHGLDAEVGPSDDPPPTIAGDPLTELDLVDFSTIVWATGYRPAYPWLPAGAFDRQGRVAHDGGVGVIPGLFFLGLPFLRRRRSNLIAGLGVDATELRDHIVEYLDRLTRERGSLARLLAPVSRR